MRKTVIAALVLTVALGVTVEASSMQAERFITNAVSMGTVSGSTRLEFVVERWTTEEERQNYLRILAEGGNDALVDALHSAEGIGRVRLQNQRSYPLSYAYQFEAQDGSRRVVLATDRPIGGLEAFSNARTLDYSVSIAELRFDAEENSEGALMVGAKIIVDREHNTITLENFGEAPVRLRNIRSQ